MPHVYSALLEPEREGGFTVTFPEIGVGATYGATWNEALRQAEDMLEEAVLGFIAHGEEVPEPAPQTRTTAGEGTHRAPVALPALTAAKLELYRAMHQAKLDRKEALKLAAKERGLTRRAAYDEVVGERHGQARPQD